MVWRVMQPGSGLGEMVVPLCKLCNSREENPVHFLAVCNALQAQHQVLLSPTLLNLPDPAHDPSAFMEIILGIDWINNLEAQAYFIQYITDHKKIRSIYQPTVNTPPFRCTLLTTKRKERKAVCALIGMHL